VTVAFKAGGPATCEQVRAILERSSVDSEPGLDTPVAIKAMAAKLARLIYRTLRYGTKYVDNGSRYLRTSTAHSRDQAFLKLKATTLGFHLVPLYRPPKARGASGEKLADRQRL